MGQTWSSFYSYWFPNKEYKLIVVGLDNAGKTTTLYRLHLGQAVVTHPTIGSNVEQVTFRNLQFEVSYSWACLFYTTVMLLSVPHSMHRSGIWGAKLISALHGRPITEQRMQ